MFILHCIGTQPYVGPPQPGSRTEHIVSFCSLISAHVIFGHYNYNVLFLIIFSSYIICHTHLILGLFSFYEVGLIII